MVWLFVVLRRWLGLEFQGDDVSVLASASQIQPIDLSVEQLSVAHSRSGTASTASSRSLRIVCISDTHLAHREIDENFLTGDILVHCGDFGHWKNGGEENARDFNAWLGETDFQIRLVVAGAKI